MHRLFNRLFGAGLLAACALTASVPAQPAPPAGDPQTPNAAALGERLKALDRNGDGVLSADEVPNPMMLQRLDTNGDGKVTMEEAQAAITARFRNPQPMASMEERFKRFDRNGDGALTEDELNSPVLFKRMDTNGDGKVTLDEMKALASQMHGQSSMPGSPLGGFHGGMPMMGNSNSIVQATAMQTTTGLHYAEIPGVDPALTSLDIYSPLGASDAPVMVYIHGGGWSKGDKSAVGAKPKLFTGAGYVFVSINYRLSPAVKHPAHVQDVAAALAWVHDNIGLHGGNPGQIFLMGHSAGAHLACLVAMNDKYLKEKGKDLRIIKGVVLLDNPILSFETLKKSMQGNYKMMQDAFGDDENAWRDAAPLAHVDKAADRHMPPIMFITGSPVGQELPMVEQAAQLVRDAGVRAEVVDARSFKTHATLNTEFGLPDDSPTLEAMAFLKSLQRGGPAATTVGAMTLGATKILEGKPRVAMAGDAAATTSSAPAATGDAGQRAAGFERLREFLRQSDTNRDGKLSREEAPPMLKDHFDQLDTDKDGQLTPEELRAAMMRLRERRAEAQAPNAQ